MAYQYRPLLASDPRHGVSGRHAPFFIRVMILLPGRFGTPIRCDLKRVMIESSDWVNQPHYEALSWAWGDPEDVKEIQIGKRTLQVPANLEPALQHLRYEQYPRTLWVDATCINQADLEERSQQVRSMGRIYFCARRVLIWLGPGDSHSDIAFDFIERTSSISIQKAREFCLATSDEYDPDDEWNFLIYKSETQAMPIEVTQSTLNLARKFGVQKLFQISNTEFHALWMTFSNRPWWLRLWVLQELVYGNRPLLICGHRSIYFDDVAVFVSKAILVLHDTYRCRSIGAFMEHFNGYWRARKTMCSPAWSFTWNNFYIVQELQDHICSDPRDRIFATLNLIPFRAASFEPDYSLSVTQVFINAARAVIQEGGNLHVLCLTSQPTPEDRPEIFDEDCKGWKLPTWAHTWAPYRGHRNSISAPDISCSYDADKHTGFEIDECLSFSPDSRVLTLDGVFCDAIDAIYGVSPVTLMRSHNLLAISTYPTKENLVDVVLRTMLLDYRPRSLVLTQRLVIGTDEYKSLRESFQNWLDNIYTTMLRPALSHSSDPPISNIEGTDKTQLSPLPEEDSFQDGQNRPPPASMPTIPSGQSRELYSGIQIIAPRPQHSSSLHPESYYSPPPTPTLSPVQSSTSSPAPDSIPHRLNWMEEFQDEWPIFITRKGYIGRASSKARPGDKIFIAYGSRIPFLIRQFMPAEGEDGGVPDYVGRGNHTRGDKIGVFEFACAAYVHGIMDGEAVEKLERRKSEGKKSGAEQRIHLI